MVVVTEVAAVAATALQFHVHALSLKTASVRKLDSKEVLLCH